jgi:hypothetical protein
MEDQPIDLIKYVNDSSFDNRDGERFFRIVGYTCLTFTAKKEYFHYELGKNHIINLYGSIQYYDDLKYHYYSDDSGLKISFDSNAMEVKKTDVGLWLLLIIPYTDKGKHVDYIENEIIGLFSMFFGQNYAFEVRFRNDFRYSDMNLQMYGGVIENPEKINKLDINKENMQIFSGIIDQIENIDEINKNKVLSSLRWYRKANGQFGVEGFIYLWTALEIIGKNGTQELRLLKEKMVIMYDLKDEEIENKTYIGHIESFRGKVLHRGFDNPIDGKILDYIRLIIDDLVIYEITKDKHKRALYYLTANRNEIIRLIDGYI